MNTGRTIGVAGAGSIGCFVGGMLRAAAVVSLCWRAHGVISENRAKGLRGDELLEVLIG